MTNEELDRLIATDVMGWRLGELTEIYEAPVPIGWMQNYCVTKSRFDEIDNAEEKGYEIWQPTHDIAQAFEAVAKMRENGYAFYLDSTAFVDKWMCTFANKDDGWVDGAETPALAICNAIYNVLESEK